MYLEWENNNELLIFKDDISDIFFEPFPYFYLDLNKCILI